MASELDRSLLALPVAGQRARAGERVRLRGARRGRARRVGARALAGERRLRRDAQAVAGSTPRRARSRSGGCARRSSARAGNKSRAARSLGLSRQGLLKKLRRYGLGDAESASLALDSADE